MTATQAPPPSPAPPPAAPLGAPPGVVSGPRARRDPAAGAAELLLVAVSIVAVAGLARLFRDSSVVLPLLVAVLAAHAVAYAGRRAAWGVSGTALSAAAGLVLQVSMVLYPHTSYAGLPTGATASGVGADLARAWALFGDVVAPAPRSRGFLVACTVAIWLAVGLADWAAFRLRATAEAVLPALALFVFSAILGAGGGGVVAATALSVAVACFALAQRTRRSAAEDAWVAGRARVGASALTRVGAGLAVVCAVAAAVLAPRLPGAQAEALLDWRGGNGPSSRLTVSPLVDIRSRLVQQSDAVVFMVTADRPAYWRLTSLDRFDGQVWSSSESFSEADGGLPTRPSAAATTPLEQTFRITALGTIWAPAALSPVELVDTTTELRWNGELATLIVPASQTAIDAASYTVVSAVPDHTPDTLDGLLPQTLPAELAEATALPDDLPDVVAGQAELIVSLAGPSPYRRALALQQWFRENFTYDLDEVSAGHGNDAIEAFLAVKRGYCEQFAGTFAAMARSLGMPARVAVGFTPGETDEAGTSFTVRGRNAHAWPEVWIPDAGWVPFEPTPGRGQPDTENYTGVAPAQAEATDATAPTTATTQPDITQPVGPRTGDVDDLRAGAAPTTAVPTSGGGTRSRITAVIVGVAGLAVALVVLDVAVLAAWRLRRRHQRRAASTVPTRVGAAWADAVDAVGRAGMVPRAAETDREFATRAGSSLGPESPSLTRLAALVTGTTWAPSHAGVDPAVADEADDLSLQVVDRARRDLSWRQRVRNLVDPRPVLVGLARRR